MNAPLLLEFFGLGALLGADQAAGPQLMLGQPVVAGALAGFLVGAPELGGLIGFAGQMAWNGAVPVGSRPNPDVSGGTLAGVLAGSAALPAEGLARAAALGMAVAFVSGWAGKYAVFWNRRWNARWTRGVLAAPAADRPARARAAQVWAWLATAALSGAWVLACGCLGALVGPPALSLVPRTAGGGGIGALLWGLGLAAALLAFVRRPARDWPWLVGGAAAAAGLKLAGAF